MTRRRQLTGALTLLVVAAAVLAPRAASASKADAFEGKIQPVSGQLYRKAGRFELTLSFDRSLNDAFFQKGGFESIIPFRPNFFGGVKLGYHLSESLSFSMHAAFGSSAPTASTTVCPTGESCHPATETQLRQVPGRIRYIIGPEVAWSPIYGKLNTFSEKVAHLDLSILWGLDVIVHDQVLSTAEAEAGVEPVQLIAGLPPLPLTSGDLPFATHVGVGIRLFVAEYLAVRLDLKDYIYGVTVPNGRNGTGSLDVQNQLMAELGVSVFFPFTNRRLP